MVHDASAVEPVTPLAASALRSLGTGRRLKANNGSGLPAVSVFGLEASE